MFVNEPSNVTVVEGGSSYFPCEYTTVTVAPVWVINGITRTSSNLPLNHYYNGSGLVILNVNVQLNGSCYSCIVYYFTGMNIETLRSRKGCLTVSTRTEFTSMRTEFTSIRTEFTSIRTEFTSIQKVNHTSGFSAIKQETLLMIMTSASVHNIEVRPKHNQFPKGSVVS